MQKEVKKFLFLLICLMLLIGVGFAVGASLKHTSKPHTQIQV